MESSDWEDRFDQLKPKVTVFSEQDEYKGMVTQDICNILWEKMKPSTKSFISQELSKAREEGRQEASDLFVASATIRDDLIRQQLLLELKEFVEGRKREPATDKGAWNVWNEALSEIESWINNKLKE